MSKVSDEAIQEMIAFVKETKTLTFGDPPVNLIGFPMAIDNSLFSKELRTFNPLIRAIPWPRPFIPIADVIPRPEITLRPSSKTKRVLKLMNQLTS